MQSSSRARGKLGKLDWVDRNNQSTKWPFFPAAAAVVYPRGNNAALIHSFGALPLYSILFYPGWMDLPGCHRAAAAQRRWRWRLFLPFAFSVLDGHTHTHRASEDVAAMYLPSFYRAQGWATSQTPMHVNL